MASYAITGATGGIGLELVKQLLDLPASQASKVFAISRGKPSDRLDELLKKNPGRAFSVKAILDDNASVKAAAAEIESELAGKGLDVLVNNAGISKHAPSGIASMDEEQLSSVFDVNVIGVQRMTSAFIHLLEKGQLKKVINISTTLGAISWSHKFAAAPNFSYKVTKAALNMLTVQWALQYAEKGFTFLCVSPGWLKTESFGGDSADLPVATGVTEVKRILLEATPEQNGKFYNIHVPGMEKAWGQYDGKEVSW